ncbi:hypothetical protein AX14_011823 [Amanita brunnescens Koide BX004]|nr:hypothetical protein AX14_011823 [Amanita brunnescens Koide BX004]
MPGPPPASPPAPVAMLCLSCSASPALFRHGVGNGSPPPGFDSYDTEYDDDAYARALADADTCDNSSCPGGPDAPARYTITVEVFDDGMEEFYDRDYRACTTCNRACKKSFLGSRIKSRQFDSSAKVKPPPSKDFMSYAPTDPTEHNSLDVTAVNNAASKTGTAVPTSYRTAPIPGSVAYAHEHPADEPAPVDNDDSEHTDVGGKPSKASAAAPSTPLTTVSMLQDALLTLSGRPPTPAAFVAIVRVKHDAMCSHPVSSCSVCLLGLVCCSCNRLFTPAVARHLACMQCEHVAFSCCNSVSCCKCGKLWMPSDSVLSLATTARSAAMRPRGGVGSDTGAASSPEPDIWTPSPRSSLDEIDDLTARAALPLPASHSSSDASRAPSRASDADVPVNIAATPLPTPDYSSIADDLIDGLMHPSFPDRAILDDRDK